MTDVAPDPTPPVETPDPVAQAQAALEAAEAAEATHAEGDFGTPVDAPLATGHFDPDYDALVTQADKDKIGADQRRWPPEVPAE